MYIIFEGCNSIIGMSSTTFRSTQEARHQTVELYVEFPEKKLWNFLWNLGQKVPRSCSCICGNSTESFPRFCVWPLG